MMGPAAHAVVAYRVWVGTQQTTNGSITTKPTQRHRSTSRGEGEVKKIKLPSQGEVVVLSTFLTRQRLMVNRDAQYSIQGNQRGIVVLDILDGPRKPEYGKQVTATLRRGLRVPAPSQERDSV